MSNFIRKTTRIGFLCLALLCTIVTTSFAQLKDSRGKDFWLMFNTNFSTPQLTLFITSDVNTSGVVTIPGLGFSSSFTVTANAVTPVTIPVSASQHTNGVIDNKGIHVTAQQEVTVYGLNYAPFTTDAYLGLPTDVLGTEYIVASYSGQNGSEFGIVATVDGTVVTITPSVAAGGHPAGVPFNITLNQGQTYELGQTSDLTGTIITSADDAHPIGVMGANRCANIPPGFTFCDHINEMLPPTTTWGKKFGTVPLKARINGDTWRFIASENNTVITINGVAQPAINKAKWVEKVLTTQSVVESDKPILAVQYSNGSSFSGNPGDPFMMIIPPLEQFLPKYTVTTVSGYAAHYINVIAPATIVGSLMMDGAVVPAGSFTPIGATGFSGAQLTVTPGTHNLQGTLPFGVFMYGFNTDDSYGYPGGQSFSEIATVSSLTLTPENGTAQVGTSQCFTAVVKDQFNNPVPGVRVDFNITGANPGSSGFDFTNASGVATFCYDGPAPGTDNIKASVGSVSDNSKFVWTDKPADGPCPGDITVTAPSCTDLVKVSWTAPRDTFPDEIITPGYPGPGTGILEFFGMYNGHGYYRSSTGTLLWNAGLDLAKQLTGRGIRGYLAVSTSQGENNFLMNEVAGLSYAHQIGLFYEKSLGKFIWFTNEPLNFKNWAAGEPSVGTNPRYVVMAPNGTWRDTGLVRLPFLTEFETKLIKYRQYKGPKNGSMLAVGTYEVCYERTNLITQKKDSCCFKISVNCNSSRTKEVSAPITKGFNVVTYPNPSKSLFNISIKTAQSELPVSVKIMDQVGRVIENRTSVSANQNIQVGNTLSPGVYIMQVTQGSEKIITRLVKNK